MIATEWRNPNVAFPTLLDGLADASWAEAGEAERDYFATWDEWAEVVVMARILDKRWR